MEMRRACGMFFLRRTFIFFSLPWWCVQVLSVSPEIIIALCLILLQVKKKVDENVEIWYHINTDKKRVSVDPAEIIRKALKKLK